MGSRRAARSRQAQAALGAAAQPFTVDVTSAATSSAATRATAEAQGGIDVLVCSAGITGPNAPLADYPVDAWKRVFDVNVHGVFLCNRAVVPIMRGKDYGRIVNIASVAGKEGNPNASAYSASKAARDRAHQVARQGARGTGIRVNCVTPAAVRTGMFDADDAAAHRLHAVEDPDGALRQGRGDRVARVLARERGMQLLDRRACSTSSGGRATYLSQVSDW